MDYLIGDLQGCCDALERLLAEIGFSPSRDHVAVLGDLVNRGPQSLPVLQRLRGLGNAATCLLGNHDLHLLAVAYGVRPRHRNDTLDAILEAPDRLAWLDWLRQRPLAALDNGWLLVHAGVPPQWGTADTLRHAGEAEEMLRGAGIAAFLPQMYGNQPARWDPDLRGPDRLRFTINALTRMRLCGADGTLDFKAKGGAEKAPPGLMPWFEVPGRRTAGVPVAFGHWSTLGLTMRPDLMALDTGCVWGGALTAVRVDGGRQDLVQVPCPAAAEIEG